MTQRGQYVDEKGASEIRAPKKASVTKPIGYASEGVEDHDIFELPGQDWQILGVLTLVASVVRLFRIYQPSSVVFDEVQ
jgi:dolichyl-phosphate-mannose-protein mannosyltransferase